MIQPPARRLWWKQAVRVFRTLFAGAVLAFAGWHGVRFLSGDKASAEIGFASSIDGSDLPDSAEEWEGRIDYRALDRQLAELAGRPEMAGLAVAVVEKGELRFVGTYGVADRSAGAPVTPQTVFRWASVSKTATGALAAALAHEGKADLDRPIASWQNSLRLPGDAQTHLTLAQLLAQQTGLPKNAFDERLEGGESPAALRAMLAGVAPQCPPGTCHSYQNIAFDAASEILGVAARQPFAQAVGARFFGPLGMASARYGMDGLTGARDWARPHDAARVRSLREAYWRVPAAAGIESDIVDFARWMQAMMGERPDVLPPAMLRIAQAPRVETGRLYGGALRQANSDAAYGLGWRSFSYAGHRIEGHSGAVDGYRATMLFEPATRTGVVAMWNSNWGWPFRIPFAVIDSYHQRPDSPWLDLGELS